jgi:EmrB/QacA subfamily drug resistance transporter
MDGPIHTPGKWLVFSLVAVGIFMSTLDGSIVNVALPTIMKDFGTPMATVEWVMMIYLLTVSALLLPFGRLSDIRGRRWVYSRGLLVFSAGSLLCGAAPGALFLIGARAFQGVGAAMVMACTPALVADAFPPAERGRALGMVGTVVASGLTLGPALGGWIIELFSWPVIFYINIPIGSVTAVIVDRLLRGGAADVQRPEAFDWAGAAFLLVWLSTALVAITHAYEWGATSVRVFVLAGVSAAALVGLVVVERRVSHPIVEPSLLTARLFVFPLASATILFIGLFSMVFLMPFFMQHPAGFSVSHTGHLMITPFVFLFAVSPVSGWLYDRMGSRLLCTLGMAILAAALLALSRLTPAAGDLDIAWRMGLAGLGTAIFISPNSAAIIGAVPPARRGLAASTVATARNLGMVLGIALAGATFNAAFAAASGGGHFETYRPEIAPIFMAAYRRAMMAGAIAAGLGVIASWLRGPERSRPPESGHAAP